MLKQNVPLKRFLTITRLELFINQTLKTKIHCLENLFHRYRFIPQQSAKNAWTGLPIPRSTGYESLHLTVLGPDKNGLKFKFVPKEWTKSLKKVLQRIINTKKVSNKTATIEILNVGFLRLEKSSNNNKKPFHHRTLDNIKLNLYSKEVFVFTPKGEIKILPVGSTLWILRFRFTPIWE